MILQTNESECNHSKKPLTRVSKRVPGVYGKEGLKRGWQKRLAKGWQRFGEGLAQGWRRVGGFPCTLQYCNFRSARLEEGVVGGQTRSYLAKRVSPTLYVLFFRSEDRKHGL